MDTKTVILLVALCAALLVGMVTFTYLERQSQLESARSSTS
jgi:hypothetical protein